MFAKIFGPDDNQVLVTGVSRDGLPALEFTRVVSQDGTTITIRIGYDEGEEGCAERDAAFLSVDEERALEMRDAIRKLWRVRGQGEE